MLEIRSLRKTFGNKVAVSDLSLHIAPGEIYGFIGHNGAGKTTTLKCVTGIYLPDAGEITVNGISILKDPLRAKQDIAYIPDNPELYEFLTGIRYLNFVADIYAVPQDIRQERIHRYGDIFGLTKDFAKPISSYSHGMKQKLAIIAALVHEPKLLIMDEPFVGLDPMSAHAVKGIMRELCDRGSAIFFSTHVLDVAEKLCDKIAVIKDGELIFSGKMEDMVKDSSLEQAFIELSEKDGEGKV